MYTSGTLREAFQQLFFVLTVEFSLTFIRRATLRTLLMLGASVVLGASLHGAVAVAEWRRRNRCCRARRRVPYAEDADEESDSSPAADRRVVAVAARWPVRAQSAVFRTSFVAVPSRRRRPTARERQIARADYLRLGPGEEISWATIPVVFGLYEVAPMPWQVEEFIDLVVFVEAIGRVVLIALAVLSLLHATRAPPLRFAEILLIFGGWLTLELAWSLGTTNWGTGARHHLVAYPAPRNRSCGVPEGDGRTRGERRRRSRPRRRPPGTDEAAQPDRVEGEHALDRSPRSVGGAGLALRPTATHHGGDSEMTMRSRPAASSRSTTWRRVKRCSNLVPNRSRASLRIT